MLLATVLALVACGGAKPETQAEPATAKVAAKEGEHGDKEGLKLSEEEAKRAGIKLEALAVQALADSVTVTATIQPNQDRLARVAPRVEGRITAVAGKLGDLVRAGQALATLDSLVIGEAASGWAQAQSSYRVAEADFKRAESLNNEEIIPKKEYLRARSEFEKAAAALRASEDKLRLLGVAPKHADASRTSGHIESVFAVTAPFAGVIVEKKATLGQLATPSEPLFVVADLRKVWIEADLTEALLSRVRVGAEASVTVTAYPGERFSGRVTYVAAMLDKEKRTIPARIEVENKDGRLKPEMFATATIVSNGAATHPAKDAAGEVLTVPDGAIVLMQGVPSVFVFEHGGYEQRAIEPGDKLGGRTVVKAGLQAGERVVAAGTYALKARVLKSQISDEH
ncbi:efflux RND transporter periplasmic adaptor subunit [Aquabacterium sp.]|uniref:efflux RND transporter periplasmic adaptor subunit n=1 Tax=Aquabacterium sp. TaxID=1872578 RepID=UPI0037839817